MRATVREDCICGKAAWGSIVVHEGRYQHPECAWRAAQKQVEAVRAALALMKERERTAAEVVEWASVAGVTLREIEEAVR